MFGWDFEVDSSSRFWRWNLIKLFVRTYDMTSRSYFGKMNSTLGSIVPLAMFMMGMALRPCRSRRLDPGCRGSKAQQAKWSWWSDTQRRAHQSALYFFTFRFVLDCTTTIRSCPLWSTLDTTGSLLKAFKGRMSPLIKLEDLLIFVWDTGSEGL